MFSRVKVMDADADCVGQFGPCNPDTMKKTFMVSVPAMGNGKCLYNDGDQVPCNQTGTQGTYATSGQDAEKIAGAGNDFLMGVGDGTRAGQGADINVVLSQGQDAGQYSSTLDNSTIDLGNKSREDVTVAGQGADKNVILSQGQDQDQINLDDDLFAPFPGAPVVKCKGSWGSCDFTTGLQTYKVTQLGVGCPNKSGDTQPCSVNFFQSIRDWIASNLTTKTVVGLLFIVMVITIFVKLFKLLV